MYRNRFSVAILAFVLLLSCLDPNAIFAASKPLATEIKDNVTLSQPNPEEATPETASDYAYQVFFPFIAATQNVRYISTDGYDPADCSRGTFDKPWKTWKKAEECIFPGVTVYFQAGTYSGIFAGKSRNKITFAGAPGRPITIKPALGDEGQVHFKQTLNIWGAHGVIAGIDINANSAYSAISIYQAQNVRLVGNKIHGSSEYDCVHIHRDSDGIWLINNKIYDCGYRNARYRGPGDAIDTTGGTNITCRGNDIHHAMRGFQIKGGARDVLVENNQFHDLEGVFNGVMMGALSGDQPQHGNSDMHDPTRPIEERYQARNVMIRNNLLYNVDGYFIMSFGGWVDFEIYNNIFFDHSGSLVFDVQMGTWEFFDSAALAYCETHTCAPCTSYSGSEPCVKVSLPSKNGNIRNNIFHTFSKVLRINPGNDTDLQIDHNLYYADGFDPHTANTYQLDGAKYCLAEFQALGYEKGTLVTDPQFVDTTDRSHPDLRLNATSPAINQGITLSDVTQDCEGIPRPQGTSHDIGAYEYVAGDG